MRYLAAAMAGLAIGSLAVAAVRALVVPPVGGGEDERRAGPLPRARVVDTLPPVNGAATLDDQAVPPRAAWSDTRGELVVDLDVSPDLLPSLSRTESTGQLYSLGPDGLDQNVDVPIDSTGHARVDDRDLAPGPYLVAVRAGDAIVFTLLLVPTGGQARLTVPLPDPATSGVLEGRAQGCGRDSEVIAVADFGLVLHASADENGLWRMPAVMAGSYAVFLADADPDSACGRRVPVTVEPGRRTWVELGGA